jgi:hypothetical protein
MSQTTLILDEKPDEPKPAAGALSDLRASAMSVPTETMLVALGEYAERREVFRDWLLKQLTEGLHYGYVPGTEPKFDASGNMISKQFDKRNNEWKETRVSPKSWQAKRCLYKAGAEFVVDLMGLRAEYSADVPAWQQLGSQPGNFVIRCRLVSKANAAVIGEGIGARKVGTKGGDENNAVKMAQKSALVAAVLNSYGLSDLFTQDIDDAPPKHPNPEHDANAPKTPPRAKRKEEDPRKTVVAQLYTQWGATIADTGKINGDINVSRQMFADWAQKVVGRQFNALKYGEWTEDDIDRCRITLNPEG